MKTAAGGRNSDARPHDRKKGRAEERGPSKAGVQDRGPTTRAGGNK